MIYVISAIAVFVLSTGLMVGSAHFVKDRLNKVLWFLWTLAGMAAALGVAAYHVVHVGSEFMTTNAAVPRLFVFLAFVFGFIIVLFASWLTEYARLHRVRPKAQALYDYDEVEADHRVKISHNE
jgi:TRAP-type C4-dicarboxylate transport system permease small subunit